jgi:protein Tex
MSFTYPLWLAQQHPQFAQAGAQAGAAAVLALAEGGATVPFIARYRKEQTGNLDEVAIRQVLDTKERWDDLVKRQAFIVEEIGRQGKLTPELEARIRGTFDSVALEDLYLPYKQKRKTKAETAREAGLGPLAEWLWDCGHGAAAGETPEAHAAAFVDAEKGEIGRAHV